MGLQQLIRRASSVSDKKTSNNPRATVDTITGGPTGQTTTTTHSTITANGSKLTSVIAFARTAENDNETVEIQYSNAKMIGSGSFGVVYRADLIVPKNQAAVATSGATTTADELKTQQIHDVAIKKVFQDRRYKNRELQIMKILQHDNVVQLEYYFYSMGDTKDEIYLNLVLEFMPFTAYQIIRNYYKLKRGLPINWIRLLSFQIFRGLSYMHSSNFCHRDIKPQNLLVNDETGVIKICDFGSAKAFIPNEKNVSYICSRYYRAPELIFGAENYSTQIDIWSVGCVIGEMLLGRPLFPGESSVDQLVEIIKLRGTPNKLQISQMNPSYQDFKLPEVKQQWLGKILFNATNANSISKENQDLIHFIDQLLIYTPAYRPTAMQTLGCDFFKPLNTEGHKEIERLLLPNANGGTSANSGRESKTSSNLHFSKVKVPNIYNFNESEMKEIQRQKEKLEAPNSNADQKNENIELKLQWVTSLLSNIEKART